MRGITRNSGTIGNGPGSVGSTNRSLTQQIGISDWRAVMDYTRSQAEQWRPISGFEGLYDVSDHGRIRRSPTSSGRGAVPGRILSAHTNGGASKHQSVDLYRGCIGTKVYVHRAVASAFLPKTGGDVVRHLDDDPSNNHVSNLAWGTQADNVHDMLRAGRARGRYSGMTHCARGHAFDAPNTHIAPSGQRVCRACSRRHSMTSYYKNRPNNKENTNA